MGSETSRRHHRGTRAALPSGDLPVAGTRDRAVAASRNRGWRPLTGRRIRAGLGSLCRLGQRSLQVPNSGFGIILVFHSPMLAYQDHDE